MKVLYDGPAMEERKSKWGDHSNRSIAAGDVANQGRHYEARAAGGHRARSARVADHRRFKLAPVVALALCGYKYCTIKHGPCAVVSQRFRDGRRTDFGLGSRFLPSRGAGFDIGPSSESYPSYGSPLAASADAPVLQRAISGAERAMAHRSTARRATSAAATRSCSAG